MPHHNLGTALRLQVQDGQPLLLVLLEVRIANCISLASLDSHSLPEDKLLAGQNGTETLSHQQL